MLKRLLLSAVFLLAAVGARGEISSVVTFPGGVNGDVQINKGSRFGVDSGLLTYSTTTHKLSSPWVAVSTMTINGRTYYFPQSAPAGGTFWRNDGAGGITMESPSTFVTSTGVAFGVFDGDVQITSPTKAINFNGSQFIVSLQGSTTAAVRVDPSTITVMGPLSAATPVTLSGSTFGVDCSSATCLGSSVNAASKLIQADSMARFPALDGSQITGLTGANISNLDISADTNLAVDAPIVLTGDTLSLSKTISQAETFAASVTVNATGYFPYGVSASSIAVSSVTVLSGYLTDSLSLLSGLHTLGVTYDYFYNHAQLNSSLGFGLGGYYYISASSGTTFDNGAYGGAIRLGTDGAYLGYGNSASLGNSYFRAASGGPTIGGYLSVSSFTAAAFNTSATSATVTGTDGFYNQYATYLGTATISSATVTSANFNQMYFVAGASMTSTGNSTNPLYVYVPSMSAGSPLLRLTGTTDFTGRVSVTLRATGLDFRDVIAGPSANFDFNFGGGTTTGLRWNSDTTLCSDAATTCMVGKEYLYNTSSGFIVDSTGKIRTGGINHKDAKLALGGSAIIGTGYPDIATVPTNGLVLMGQEIAMGQVWIGTGTVIPNATSQVQIVGSTAYPYAFTIGMSTFTTPIVSVSSNGLVNLSTTTVSSMTVANLNATTSLQGAGLSTCGDSTHALSWTGGTFSCQNVTGSTSAGGVVVPSTFTWGSVTTSSFTAVTANITGVLTSSSVYVSSGSVGFDEIITVSSVSWTTSNKQMCTLTKNETFTFTAPAHPASLILKINTGAGSFTATWPATVKWSGGTAPTITATASKVDIVACYYAGDGNYYCSWQGNF